MESMDSSWSVDLKLELINKKLDKLLEEIAQVNLKKKKEISTETNWSLEESDEGIFVRFSYNNPEMKEFIKSIGARWFFKKKAWTLPNKEAIEKIKEKYPKN